MAGWRETVSEQAQGDMDGLTGAAMDFALDQLDTHGGFLPFALAVSLDGDVQVVQPNTARDADLDATAMIDASWRALARVNASVRAAVVAVDVRLPKSGSDGIDLTVEHREGVAINIVFPYTQSGSGDYNVGSPVASSANSRVWSNN